MIAWLHLAGWKLREDWWASGSVSTPKTDTLTFLKVYPSHAPNHRAISHLLVGNRGEYWGPNSLLMKTGHTTAAIKLEGMSGARLVISLSVSLGLHLSRLLLEKQNERQAQVCVLRVSPHWTLRAEACMCEQLNVGWWRAFGGDEKHISQARQIKEWRHGWWFAVFLSPFLQLFLFSLPFVYLTTSLLCSLGN